MIEHPWWKTAVVYQIYPRSFADANGDGIGDLPAIRAHLDHLAWLGVDAIWLSPFYPSPMKDFGYDVSDYCDVDPVFGTLADLDALVADAHELGLRVLIDFVLNHTSDQHRWFVESRSSRTNPKRDWYHWRDLAADGSPPNDWTATFVGGTTWQLDETTGQAYLHLYLPEQPDLNWGNPEVVAAMHGVLQFWLDRGIDGFRLDAVQCLGKDPAFPAEDSQRLGRRRSAVNDDPRTHEYLRGLRALSDTYPGERLLVGEVCLPHAERLPAYHGEDDELHLAFNFPALSSPWEPEAWRAEVERVERLFPPGGAWPTWALGNHDLPRQRTRYASDARARAAAVLLLGARGTPFLYQGEELGLADADVPAERVVDPGGRDGCRAPLPWTSSPPHGWVGADPWLPFPPDPGTRSVEAERTDPTSMLHLYRRLLATRRRSAALQVGELVLLDAPRGVVAWRHHHGDDERTVAINFTSSEVEVDLGPGLLLEVASDGFGEGLAFSGTLGPDQAVILQPSTSRSSP